MLLFLCCGHLEKLVLVTFPFYCNDTPAQWWSLHGGGARLELQSLRAMSPADLLHNTAGVVSTHAHVAPNEIFTWTRVSGTNRVQGVLRTVLAGSTLCSIYKVSSTQAVKPVAFVEFRHGDGAKFPSRSLFGVVCRPQVRPISPNWRRLNHSKLSILTSAFSGLT